MEASPPYPDFPLSLTPTLTRSPSLREGLRPVRDPSASYPIA